MLISPFQSENERLHLSLENSGQPPDMMDENLDQESEVPIISRSVYS